MPKTVKNAKDAIDSIFADRSCSQEETKERLEEIVEHIEMCICSLDVLYKDAKMTTKKEQFDKFYDENPGVMTLFFRFTNELTDAGRTRIRVDEVLRRVHWEMLTTGDYTLADRLKTSYGNRFAMEMIARDAAYIGLFEFEITSDDQ